MPPGSRLAGILLGLGIETVTIRAQLRELLALDDVELDEAIAAASASAPAGSACVAFAV